MRDYHYDDDDVKNDHRYSWRKRYQRGYGEESASPLLKEYLDNMENKPNVIERHDAPTGRIINWWRDIKGHYE